MRRVPAVLLSASLVAGITALPVTAEAATNHSDAAKPTITSVSPHAAKVGRRIRIVGSHFTPTSTVRVDGRLTDSRNVNTTHIVALVPGGASTGRVTVTNGRRTAESARPLVVAKADSNPTITFSPSSGPVGTSVTITDSMSFTAPCSITWGNNISEPCSNGSISNGTTSTDVINVPAHASTGVVTVTSEGGTGTSTTPFRVTLGIQLPDDNDHPGATVTLNGSGFNANESVSIYEGTTLTAYASADSVGTFSYPDVTIPMSASPGDLQITAIGARSGSSCQALFTVSTNWTSLGFNSSGDRYNPYENTLSTTNVSNLGLDWTASTGNQVVSEPAIADGVAYFTSQDGYLYAVNATTGAVLWSYQAGGSSTSSPTVSGGVVYFGATDDKLYAVSITTHQLLWSLTTGNEIISSPVVVNGVVYVGSFDHYVYAVNASNGSLKWSYETGGLVVGSPSVANGVVYIGSTDDNLYALDANAGTKLWQFATGGSIESQPAVVDNIVYVGSYDHNLYAVNASTGTQLWSATTDDMLQSAPAVANGTVYIGSQDGALYAYNALTGAQDWTTTIGTGFYGSPAVANGVVYIGSANFRLYAVNASNGNVLWFAPTGSYISTSANVVNGIVYVGSDDHKLYAFDLNGPGTQPGT